MMVDMTKVIGQIIQVISRPSRDREEWNWTKPEEVMEVEEAWVEVSCGKWK